MRLLTSQRPHKRCVTNRILARAPPGHVASVFRAFLWRFAPNKRVVPASGALDFWPCHVAGYDGRISPVEKKTSPSHIFHIKESLII